MELLMVIAVTIMTGDRLLDLCMAAVSPVADDAGGNPFMTLDTLRWCKHACYYLA